MKIANIKTVTSHYISGKKRDYCIVSFDLIDRDKKDKELYPSKKQYGTISYEFIDDNGCLTKPIRLGNMAHAETIPLAIKNREYFESIEDLTFEELIDYWKNQRI